MDIYNSTEEITEANKKVGLDVEYFQMGKGQYRGIFTTAVHGNSVFIKEQGSVSMYVSGQVNNDEYLFVMPQSSMVFGAEEVAKGQLLVIPPGAEINVSSSEAFKADQVCIPRRVADKLLTNFAQEEVVLPQRQLRLDLNNKRYKRFSNTISKLVNSNCDESAMALDVEEELLHSLLSINNKLKQDKYRVKGRPLADYNRIFNKAKDYLSANIQEANLLEQVCIYTQVSLRTLERVFIKQIGISPYKYILTLRMNAIHKDLLKSSSFETSVTDVTLKYNINHMGRFASNYYEFFQEYPSETLLRS